MALRLHHLHLLDEAALHQTLGEFLQARSAAGRVAEQQPGGRAVGTGEQQLQGGGADRPEPYEGDGESVQPSPGRVERGLHGPDDGHHGRRVPGGDGGQAGRGPGGAEFPQNVEAVTGEGGDHARQGHGPRPERPGEFHAPRGVPEQRLTRGQFVREHRYAHEAGTAQRGAQGLQVPGPPGREQQGPQLLARQGRFGHPGHPGQVARGRQIADERGIEAPVRRASFPGRPPGPGTLPGRPLGPAGLPTRPLRYGGGPGRTRRLHEIVAHRVRERGQRLRGERRRRRADGDPQPAPLGSGRQEHVRPGGRRCEHAVTVLPGDGQRPAALRSEGGEVQVGEEELRGERQPAGQRRHGPLVRARLGGLGGDAPQVVLEPRAAGPSGRRTGGAQRDRRGERPEHPVRVGQGVLPAAHREAEHQVAAAGDGCQGPVVGGEDGCVEARAAAGGGEPAQRRHLAGAEREPAGVEQGSRVHGAYRSARRRRTGGESRRSVGRTEPRPPAPGVRACACGCLRTLSESAGVVVEGAARRCRGGFAAVRERVVHGRQLTDQERGAVAVADDVVGVHHQDVLVGGDGEHAEAQQRPRPRLEAAGPLGGDPLLDLLRAVDGLEVDGEPQRGRKLLLDRRTGPCGEDGAQHRVAGDEGVHRALEAVAVEVAAQPQPGEPRRGGARGQGLGQQEAPLRRGERDRRGSKALRPFPAGALGRQDDRGLRHTARRRLVQRRRERRESPVAVDGGRPGERSAVPLQPGEHLQHEQGVAAQDEEVVLTAHVVGPEEGGPDAGQPDLRRCTGRRARCRTGRGRDGRTARTRAGFRARPRRGGRFPEAEERAAVDLPGAGQRHPVDPGDPRRQHVRGQRPCEVVPELRGLGLRCPVTGSHEGDEAALLDEDDGAADVGADLEHRLDLTRLDPVATDLHLVVQSPEELQDPVLRTPHPVAAAVPAATVPDGERGLGERRFAQISGGQPDAGDQEFAGLAGGPGLALGSDDHHPRARHRPADREPPDRVVRPGADDVAARVDGRLGRTVQIGDPLPVAVEVEPAADVGR